MFRDVKRRLGGATENSRRTPLRGRTACRRVALSRRPWARPSPTTGEAPGSTAHRQGGVPASSPIPVQTRVLKNRATSSGASWMRNAARSALTAKFRRSSLKSPHCGDSTIASIPADLRSAEQAVHRAIAGPIVVTDDIETAQRCRKQDGSEMRGRKCCDHRHAGHDAAERQHGLDALARRHHVACRTETDRVPEKVTHRPARGIDWRLVAPGRIEPCAMRAGDVAIADRSQPRSLRARFRSGRRPRDDSNSVDGIAGY